MSGRIDKDERFAARIQAWSDDQLVDSFARKIKRTAKLSNRVNVFCNEAWRQGVMLHGEADRRSKPELVAQASALAAELLAGC